MRLPLAGPALLFGGITVDLATTVTAVREVASEPVNPYLAALCFGIGLGLTIVGAMWTSRRDRLAAAVREEKRLDDAKKEREERERKEDLRHKENTDELRANREENRELRKLIEGGIGYPGLLAAAERSEWRRHHLMNVLTPVLNDLREMAEAVCDLCEKEGIRFRREIADTFVRAAERLAEQPPLPHHRRTHE